MRIMRNGMSGGNGKDGIGTDGMSGVGMDGTRVPGDC